MILIISFAILLLGGWLLPRYWLAGEDLAIYDAPVQPLFRNAPASFQALAAEKQLVNSAPVLKTTSRKEALAETRKRIDDLGREANIRSRVTPADGAPVPAEWVCAPGADPARRVLYLHGGGFMIGSPTSHRAVTSKFSEITGACVLAIDYRLTPEHPRLASLIDCQAAYKWILDHGPKGEQGVEWLTVAGDSAGGNLTLATIAWARDAGLRPANAAVALSPATDSSMSSPSLTRNLSTDTMLRPMMEPLSRAPRSLLLWIILLTSRAAPSNPRLSPIFGDLSNLPPLLIQASNSETLEDDARRYVNKARAAGSDVELQIWANMLHVWQAFVGYVPEANEAFRQIQAFLAKH